MGIKMNNLLFNTVWIWALIIATTTAAPFDIVNFEDGPVNDEDQEGDSTTHTLDGNNRLSSAATCLVAGVEYTHGQQIYREDPCEFCLCLDGEMFCWWQDCPPTLEGPCRYRLPFSPCANGPKVAISTKAPKMTTKTSATTTNAETTARGETMITSEMSLGNGSLTEVTTSTVPSASPKTCLVMGKEYEIGASLPHDTGNCVECICGAGAQVTCSPHQCAPIGDDSNDYRPPGPRQF